MELVIPHGNAQNVRCFAARCSLMYTVLVDSNFSICRYGESSCVIADVAYE
jgi:hypothetical protein